MFFAIGNDRLGLRRPDPGKLFQFRLAAVLMSIVVVPFVSETSVLGSRHCLDEMAMGSAGEVGASAAVICGGIGLADGRNHDLLAILKPNRRIHRGEIGVGRTPPAASSTCWTREPPGSS